MTSKKADEYRELLDGFIVSSVPAENGDLDAFCPAHENPGTSKKPSARINFNPTNKAKYPNGMIACFVCRFKGDDANLDNIVRIYKQRLEAGVHFEPFDRGERQKVFGKTGKRIPLPTASMRLDLTRALLENKERLRFLRTRRGLNVQTIKKFQLGWRHQSNAYIYPVRENGDGVVKYMRLYRPWDNAEVKHSWLNTEGEHTPHLKASSMLCSLNRMGSRPSLTMVARGSSRPNGRTSSKTRLCTSPMTTTRLGIRVELW
jgi:hypothetical protein